MRALAEARDGPYYALWCDLTHVSASPEPKIGFRIFQVANTHDAVAVVSVDTSNTSVGAGICWATAVTATSDSVLVEASIELESDAGWTTVFERSVRAATAEAIAQTIADLSSVVCSERTWWPES